MKETNQTSVESPFKPLASSQKQINKDKLKSISLSEIVI